jgi:hypothetical protein
MYSNKCMALAPTTRSSSPFLFPYGVTEIKFNIHFAAFAKRVNRIRKAFNSTIGKDMDFNTLMQRPGHLVFAVFSEKTASG